MVDQPIEEKVSGTDDIVKAKEEFRHYIASLIREAIKTPMKDYDRLYKLSELININLPPAVKTGRTKKEAASVTLQSEETREPGVDLIDEARLAIKNKNGKV